MEKKSTHILALILMLLIPAIGLHAQAKKPKIMVVPSDIWCIRNGYVIDYEAFGKTKQLPDYQAAMQNNADMRAMVAAMADFMQKEDFPIASLEQELKRLESEASEEMLLESKETGSGIAESPVDKLKTNASPDIILDLDFEKVQLGPKTQIKFNLQALDAYTSKIISGNIGQGTPSGTADLTNQLQEAVLSFKDNFLSGLMNYFNSLFTDGREIVVVVRRWSDCEIDFEEEYGDQELGELIEDYMAKNTVNGRFSTASASENRIRFEQVRIPLYDENGTAIDAHKWARGLGKFIKKTTGLQCKVVNRGLGEAAVIMGGK